MCRGPAWPELATAAAPGDRSRRRAARSILRSRARGEQLPGAVRLDLAEAPRYGAGALSRVVGIELEVASDLLRSGLDQVSAAGLDRDQAVVLGAHRREDVRRTAVEPQREHRDGACVGDE